MIPVELSLEYGEAQRLLDFILLSKKLHSEVVLAALTVSPATKKASMLADGMDITIEKLANAINRV